MRSVANETVVVDAPAPQGEVAEEPEDDPELLVVPLVLEPVVLDPVVLEPVVLEPVVLEPLPPEFDEPDSLPEPLPEPDEEQPLATETEAIVAKERMREIEPRMKTVLSA
jgi:hypothetical protein